MKDSILNFYYNNMSTINIIVCVILLVCLIIGYAFRNQIKNLYIKHKEIINYVIVGGLTTLVSIGSYWLFRLIINNYIILSIISWILAVAFAYIANRIFVFESKNCDITKEIIKFVSCRITTLIMEVILMVVFVSIFKIDDMISKIILQVVVLVLNYIFSKIFVFKGGEE